MYATYENGTLIKSSYHLHWWVGVQTPHPHVKILQIPNNALQTSLHYTE